MSSAKQLVIEIRAQLKEVAEKLFTHPYLDALEEARIPKEKVHLFAGEWDQLIITSTDADRFNEEIAPVAVFRVSAGTLEPA